MRNTSKSRYLPITFAFIYAVCFSTNAYASLEPGTRSYILQVLIAAIVGGLFAIKPFWTKIPFWDCSTTWKLRSKNFAGNRKARNGPSIMTTPTIQCKPSIGVLLSVTKPPQILRKRLRP